MHADLDYPNVRASDFCPLCRQHKERGLVTCWTCYRERALRYVDQSAETVIKQVETKLSEQRLSQRDP